MKISRQRGKYVTTLKVNIVRLLLKSSILLDIALLTLNHFDVLKTSKSTFHELYSWIVILAIFEVFHKKIFKKSKVLIEDPTGPESIIKNPFFYYEE